jgi:hypothetical protein
MQFKFCISGSRSGNSGSSGNSEKSEVPDFSQLGFSRRPPGPPPLVRDHNLYLRLNKELEKCSFSIVVLCCSLLNKTLDLHLFSFVLCTDGLGGCCMLEVRKE